MKRSCVLLFAAGVFGLALNLNAADIVGTVTLEGTPPAEKAIGPLKEDATCGKFYTDMPTTHFYTVGPNKELADVVVMLKGVTGQSKGASAEPAVIDQKGCLYLPQFIAVQTGQKITVKNSDPVAHNIHPTPTVDGNSENNQLQPPGGDPLTFSFPKAENFLRFKCDVHQWMFAWVTVVDSPYFAVTDKDGKFKISGVPAGKYTITAMHYKVNKAGLDKDIEVKDGEPTKVDFTLEVK